MKKFLLALPLFCVVFVSAQAQDRKVSGQVTSAKDGSELPGVSIRVKGTNQGTMTDTNGMFDLIASPTDTLQFTFVGFITRETVVGNRTTINIPLETETT